MNRKLFVQPLFGLALVLTALFFWRFFYLLYIELSGYEKDVFRDGVRYNLAPVYGQWILRSEGILYACFAFIFIIPWVLKTTVSKQFWFLFFIAAAFIPTLFFNHLFSTPSSHWETFANDMNLFSSSNSVWSSFNEIQSSGKMDVHNNHYPPLNLFLLKWMGQSGLPLLRVFFWFCMVSAIWVSSKIRALLVASNEKRNSFLPFLLLSPAFILYPALEPSGFFFLCTSICIYLFVQPQRGYMFSGFLGIVIFLMSISNFNALIVFLWMGIFILFQWFNKKSEIKSDIKYISIAISIAILLLSLLFFKTDFSWITCLSQSIKNNALLGASGFDNPIRYLFRSTGNLLAFIAGNGFIIPILWVIYFLKKTEGKLHFLKLSTGILLLICSFSGLFFIETERIWTFIFAGMALTFPIQNEFFDVFENRYIRFLSAFIFLLLLLFWKPFL